MASLRDPVLGRIPYRILYEVFIGSFIKDGSGCSRSKDGSFMGFWWCIRPKNSRSDQKNDRIGDQRTNPKETLEEDLIGNRVRTVNPSVNV
jgi:hypothetical protein